MARFRESGFTQAEFAHQHNIKLCAFQQWLYRSPKFSKPAVFQEVLLPIAAAELCLGRDITLKFSAGDKEEGQKGPRGGGWRQMLTA